MESSDKDESYQTPNYPFPDRVKYWTDMYAGGVNDDMFASIQFACIVQSGIQMQGSGRKKTHEQYDTIQANFLRITKGLLDSGVINDHIHAQIVSKVYGSAKLDGKTLHDKFKKLKSAIMNKLLPNFKADLKNVGSGKGLSDAFDSMVLAVYKEKNPVSESHVSKE